MEIDIYSEIKRAIKDALSEWNKEKNKFSEKIVPEHAEYNLLFTINQFCEKYKFISKGGLRNRLFFREFNKFNSCISQVGNRIYLKEKETLEYFRNPPPEHNWTYDKKKHLR